MVEPETASADTSWPPPWRAAFGFQAVAWPVVASSAAILLRLAPPTLLNSPATYTVEPETASASTAAVGARVPDRVERAVRLEVRELASCDVADACEVAADEPPSRPVRYRGLYRTALDRRKRRVDRAALGRDRHAATRVRSDAARSSRPGRPCPRARSSRTPNPPSPRAGAAPRPRVARAARSEQQRDHDRATEAISFASR